MVIPRTLDMRQLKHILELDRYKNYRRAAESLCISQPALTKSIQQLEATLGVTLFDRDSGGITPTPSCKVILEHARRVLLELDEMYHRLDSLLQQSGGELKIGTGPIMAESVIPDPLRDLLEERPEVRVEVVVDDWSNLTKLTRQGELHLFVIDIARVREEPDLEVIPLGRTENILVCRAQHPLAASGQLTPRDFLEYPLALPRMTDRLSSWLTRNAPPGMLPQSFYSATHRIQCQSVALLRSLVRQTNCITGGPRRLFERELESGLFVELQLAGCDVLYSEPGIGFLKGRTLPPAALRFIEILTDSRARVPHAAADNTSCRRSNGVDLETGLAS